MRWSSRRPSVAEVVVLVSVTKLESRTGFGFHKTEAER